TSRRITRTRPLFRSDTGRFWLVHLALAGLWFLLLVQPLPGFLGVSLVVQLQQAGENFPPGVFADRVPQPLLRLMEAVAQFEVSPAVGGRNQLVHLDVSALGRSTQDLPGCAATSSSMPNAKA